MNYEWEVGKYTDTVKRRTQSQAQRILQRSWNPPNLFPTQAEAFAFVIERARLEIGKAEKELAKARKRYRKCERKFALRLDGMVE